MMKGLRFCLVTTAAVTVVVLLVACVLWGYSYFAKPGDTRVVGGYCFTHFKGSLRWFGARDGRVAGPVFEIKYKVVCVVFGMVAMGLFAQAERVGRWERRRRRICVACGRDMRGVPDRCPGCGAAVTGGRV